MRSNTETNDRYRPMGLDPNIGIVVSWWCLGCTTHRRNCISPQRMHYCRCTDQARLAHMAFDLRCWKAVRPTYCDAEAASSLASSLAFILPHILPFCPTYYVPYTSTRRYKLICLLLPPVAVR